MHPLKHIRCRLGALVALIATILPALTPATPTGAAPPTTGFMPGVWKGSAIMTGTMGAEGVTVFAEQPMKFTFTVEIAPDGSVVDGSWTASGVITSVVTGGEGTFTTSASGTLGGSSAHIDMTGTLHLSGSVTAQGIDVPVELDTEFVGGFAPTSASCSVVRGDLAAEAREAQVAAGFSTSVTGPFTAVRVAAAGDNLAPTFEEQYVELVTKTEALVAMSTPPAAEVVSLVEQAEAFYQNVFASADCPGGSPNLEPGKQPYSYFVKKVGELLLKALANPAAYSVDDIHSLAVAAVRIGVVGGATPDAVLGDQVDQALFAALETKLSEASAGKNQPDCVIIHMAANTLGFTELLPAALACATEA